MKILRAFLYLSAALLGLSGLALPFVGCVAEREVLTPADSVFVQAGMAAPRKIKGGTIIFQAPGSTNNMNDNRKSGQRQGSAANAPNAQASNASKKSGGPAWYIYLLVAAVGAAVWEGCKRLLGGWFTAAVGRWPG